MPEVPFERFEKKFKPSFEAKFLLDDIRTQLDEGKCILGFKGSDLVELVQKIIDSGLTPVVDKKLGLVIGVWRAEHVGIMYKLQEYYRTQENKDAPYVTPYVLADQYIHEGNGYYISSLGKKRITFSEQYKEDRFDKDLFLILPHDKLPDSKSVTNRPHSDYRW